MEFKEFNNSEELKKKKIKILNVIVKSTEIIPLLFVL